MGRTSPEKTDPDQLVRDKGVETLRQLEIVRSEGCTEVQGHVYSAAVPAKDVWPLLARFAHNAAVA